MDMHKEFLRLEAENERLKQQALADDLAMEAAAERDNAEIKRLRQERTFKFATQAALDNAQEQIRRLREAIQKWYDYGYDRGEAEKMLEGK